MWAQFTDIFTLKVNDPYCHGETNLLPCSYLGMERQMGPGGEAPGKCFGPRFSDVRKMPFFNRDSTIKRALLFFC